jgi:arginyl-tRNA synthetase
VVARAPASAARTAATGRPVVEFVSANPTGPLHIGHGRQAALGDAISELLAWTGWKVHREFYYNDAGEQIAGSPAASGRATSSSSARTSPSRRTATTASYVGDRGASRAREGDRFRGDDSAAALDAMRVFAVARLRAEQNRGPRRVPRPLRRVLPGVVALRGGPGRGDDRALRETGLVYEKDGALWLRTTEFGDDKDRVMVKSSGHPTYFLPDVAYHVTKWERGFQRAINVQGADHHGTVARVRAGLQALGLPEGYPEYVLHQMVLVMRGGEEVKFSKRAGRLRHAARPDRGGRGGRDALLLPDAARRGAAHLRPGPGARPVGQEPGLQGPVRARAHGLDLPPRRVDPATIRADAADLDAAGARDRGRLAKLLLRFPEVVESAAARTRRTSVCDYLEEVAGAVNSWYHAGNLDPELRVIGVARALAARLVLARAVQIVLRNGLAVLGVDRARADGARRRTSPA